jgi:hypothetical protein
VSHSNADIARRLLSYTNRNVLLGNPDDVLLRLLKDAAAALQATAFPHVPDAVDSVDAKRYRWLRTQPVTIDHGRIAPVRPDKLDAMIDRETASREPNARNA